MNKESRLGEIEKFSILENDNLKLVELNNFNWLIGQLKESWEREQKLVEALRFYAGKQHVIEAPFLMIEEGEIAMNVLKELGLDEN